MRVETTKSDNIKRIHGIFCFEKSGPCDYNSTESNANVETKAAYAANFWTLVFRLYLKDEKSVGAIWIE